MPTRLAGWVCVLTALAAGGTLAADKPKEKKDKPASPPANGGIASGIGALIGQATGNPKTGAVIGGLIGSDVGTLIGNEPGSRSNKFTITKPVGKWVREAPLGETKCVCVLTVIDDRLTLTMEGKYGAEHASVRLDADYAINKESCLFGVIDSCEVEHNQLGELHSGKLSGQPFSVRFRLEGDMLTLKDPKGFGVGVNDSPNEKLCQLLVMACGRYVSAETKQKELLNQSEGPARIPQRIHGGILKVDPSPEEVIQSAKYEVPLPSVPVVPVVRPPVPDVPPLKLPPLPGTELLKVDPLVRQDQLPKQIENRLQSEEEWRRFWFNDMPSYLTSDRIRNGILDLPCDGGTRPTTSAYAGPIGGAVPTPSRADAAVVQAKAEVSAVEPPRLILPLREDDCPTCDGTPTDAEVMQRFNAKVFKDASPGFEASHDDIVIVKNLVSNKTDAPRYYPLVGFAQTHCCRWECGVYYRDPKSGKGKVEVITIESSMLRIPMAADDPSVKMLQRMTEK